MPISNDPEKRWWVDAGGANPDLVDDFRPSLVAFLAFDRDRTPRLVGTGFVLASESEFALIISAKHVLSEGALRVQRPHPRHASSALFVPKQDIIPSLDPTKLKVIWMGSKRAAALNAAHVCYNDTIDIASCIVVPQAEDSIVERVSIPLDIDVPSVGDVVHMVAMDGMTVNEVAPPIEFDGRGQVISIFRRISIRVGVVTAVHPNGYRHYRWPCFTTSIPAEGGMSGGFVYWPREGTTIAACGVVCADNSSDEARANTSRCGESIIGCAWMALSLRIPLTIPSLPDAPTYTLFEMVRRGLVPKPLGGIERIKLVETGDGDCVIGKDA